MDDKLMEDLIAIKIHEQCRACSKNDVVNEQIRDIKEDIREIKVNVADLYTQQGLAKTAVITLVLALLISVLGYIGVKVTDSYFDANKIKAEESKDVQRPIR